MFQRFQDQEKLTVIGELWSIAIENLQELYLDRKSQSFMYETNYNK